MAVFMNGKQVRVKRPPTIAGIAVEISFHSHPIGFSGRETTTKYTKYTKPKQGLLFLYFVTQY